MLAILSKLVVVVMIAMFVPTGLVLASQEAIPGDATYPVKRALEGVIITLSSLHPGTRAFFHADLTKRRFKEAIALIRRGSNASNTLVELVSQTQTAVDIIDKIPDVSAKRVYIENLSTQIVEYQTTLKQFEDDEKIIVEPTPPGIKISPTPESISPPEIYVTPKVESLPTPTPVRSGVIPTTQPTPAIITPTAIPPTVLPPTTTPTHLPPGEPTSTPRLTSTPRPTVLPTPPPTNRDECGQVSNTPHCLERILKRICDRNPNLRVCKDGLHKSSNTVAPVSIQMGGELKDAREGLDDIEDTAAEIDTRDIRTDQYRRRNNSKQTR